jgi:hypothetical protein
VIATLFGGCIVLLALGMPVAFALGGATLAAISSASFPPLRSQISVQRHRRVRADGGPVFHPDRRAHDRRRAIERC